MKAGIALIDGTTQVMLTPETEFEKLVLRAFEPDKRVDVAVRRGMYYNSAQEAHGYELGTTRGGYLRMFPSNDSVMLVVQPKQPVSAEGTAAE